MNVSVKQSTEGEYEIHLDEWCQKCFEKKKTLGIKYNSKKH